MKKKRNESTIEFARRLINSGAHINNGRLTAVMDEEMMRALVGSLTMICRDTERHREKAENELVMARLALTEADNRIDIVDIVQGWVKVDSRVNDGSPLADWVEGSMSSFHRAYGDDVRLIEVEQSAFVRWVDIYSERELGDALLRASAGHLKNRYGHTVLPVDTALWKTDEDAPVIVRCFHDVNEMPF